MNEKPIEVGATNEPISHPEAMRGTIEPRFGRLAIPIQTLWLALAILPASAWGREMHVVASTPIAEAVMHRRNMQYIVRFDGPVDHARSRLEIVHEGNLAASLYPRLNSAPDVLFASAPAPAPGKYELHWAVKSMDGDETSEGMIPFPVAP